MSKVLSLLEAASAALAEATYIMKDSVLPLPPSPISPSASSITEVDYFFDESIFDDGKVKVNVWNVPGYDEKKLDNGRLAKVAVNTSSYGISIGRGSGPTEEVLGPLGYCLVDKGLWDVVKEISIGDIFYMADTTDDIVYRGVVTAQPVGGPFCPIRSLENSFVACLGLVSDTQLRSEVEIVFKVDWKLYSHYDKDWSEFLDVIGEGVCRLPDE